jgi:F-type H+-transporting ATPase subunit b
MQIDWITVAAQIANFLVLVWILQRLLYRPVTRAMARRAAAIRDQFEEAERREAEAVAQAEKLRAEQQALEGRRAAFLDAAQGQADVLRQRLEAEARDAVAERRQAWEDQLDREQAAFLDELRREAADHVSGLARKVLNDLAGAPLEAAMADTFIARLRALEGAALDELRAEAATTSGEMTLTSAFDLPLDSRASLRDALRETLHQDAKVAFASDPGLICGIRLRIRGQTLQWSVDAYLDDFQEKITAVLERDGTAEAAE